MDSIEFAGERIGGGAPTFLTAEVGINHNGDLELAKELIHAAAASGATAVKFQTFRTSEFISRSNPYFDLFKRCELPPQAFEALGDYARQLGIIFYSTPFDFESVDLLDELTVPGFKVASCDLTNMQLLRHIARKGKPILLSTGMATISEIFSALDTISSEGNNQVALLHCVALYPTEPIQTNLRAIPYMNTVFACPVGLSDHTLGTDIAITSVALGADLIEKHFTLNKRMDGPDHQLSADPAEFTEMVKAVRHVELALGSHQKRPVESAEHIALLRRSLVARTDITQGTEITSEMIAIKRPGSGIQPSYFDLVVGRRAKVDIREDTLLRWEDLD